MIYLIFNEGYGGRGDLSAEAIRIDRALADLMPDEPEVYGLLALMLANDARSEARFADGELVLLADQDRALWDDKEIGLGRTALDRAMALGGRGLRAAGGDRSSTRGGGGLAGDRRALWRARPTDGFTRGRAEQGRRHRRGRRPEAALELVDGLELENYHYLTRPARSSAAARSPDRAVRNTSGPWSSCTRC